jgi:hypothetical protein
MLDETVLVYRQVAAKGRGCRYQHPTRMVFAACLHLPSFRFAARGQQL